MTPSLVATGEMVGNMNETGGGVRIGIGVGAAGNGCVPEPAGTWLEGGAVGGIIVGSRSGVTSATSISDSSRAPLSRISKIIENISSCADSGLFPTE